MLASTIILSCVIGAQLVFVYYREREHMQERKDLLDRIQAPTFAEYSNKVVREIKAEQSTEPKVIDDYIS